MSPEAVITICVASVGVLGWHMSRLIAESNRAIDVAYRSHRDRHDDLARQVHQVVQIQQDQIRRDLDELQQRRMRDAGK
jgi:hypothetical protein